MRLLFVRYFIAFLALLGALIETYFGENILLFIMAGILWSVVYSIVMTDVECLKKPDIMEEK
ncbi:hypothetical protein [Thermococcus sp. 2319x1]|nr:hypothetical protein [Thermococcus sp. 2319x1]